MSLALTHFERFDWLVESIAQVHDDERIGEIVISDDYSQDGSVERLQDHFADDPKTKVFTNLVNVGPYSNKHQAVAHCSNDWVVLLDSDNVLYPRYLDALEEMEPLDPLMAYLPTFAEPAFDYRALAGQIIDRHNAAEKMGDMVFETALNTGNHAFYRQNYLNVYQWGINPLTQEAMFHNYLWLKAGYKLKFVPGMEYFHRMHPGSYVMTSEEETGMLHSIIRYQLASLR